MKMPGLLTGHFCRKMSENCGRNRLQSTVFCGMLRKTGKEGAHAKDFDRRYIGSFV